jgi:hypothetical protein
MALITPNPPRATRKAFREGLAEMIRYGRAPKDLLKQDAPREIYTLTLEEIVQGKGLGEPKPTAWEFLVGSASGPAVAVGVAHPPPGKAPRMTSVTRGPDPAEALHAAEQVAKLPQVQARNYELRRLWIAGLYIGAYWLRAREGGPDLVVPDHALARELERMRAYSMDEFLAVVKTVAEKRLKFNDAPGQGGQRPAGTGAKKKSGGQ